MADTNNKITFKQNLILKSGDKIAIISPSSGLPYLFPLVYEQGLKNLKDVFNLEPVEYPTARQSSKYLSENPKARAKDINNAFADPSIKAIIATIGGNDQIRILPYLDEKIISANPKIFMGYSDCTNLHIYLWNLGIISYYGGAIMTQFAMGGGMHQYTIEWLQKVFFNVCIGEIYSSPEYSDVDLDWNEPENLNKIKPMYPSEEWEWHNNQDQIIQGRLWGGCLEIVHLHLSIKKYLPHFDKLDNIILYLETSEEMPSDGFVYRFIATLAELGLLNKFKAILMAYPKAQFCGYLPFEGREAFIENQKNAIKSALNDYNINILVIFNMNFGHTDPQMIIPNGAMVSIDCIQKIINFIKS